MILNSMTNNGISILLFLIVLGAIVVVHEYGHYLAARRFGVFVKEFALGMGPKIAGRVDKSGTLWSIRALPIGGYCAMRGEDQTDNASTRPDDLLAKPAWQRLIIYMAGPIMNIALAYVMIVLSIATLGRQPAPLQTTVQHVLPHSVAASARLQPGSRILAIDGTTMHDGDAAMAFVHTHLHQTISLHVQLPTERVTTIRTTPMPCANDPKTGCIGFTLFPGPERIGILQWQFQDSHPNIRRIQTLFVLSTNIFSNMSKLLVGSFGLMILHFNHYSDQIMGPIGMGAVAIHVQQFGWDIYLIFIGSISFIIGCMNLVPIPGLDGGRIAMTGLELLTRRAIPRNIEARIHLSGLVFLLLVMVVVSVHDIFRIASHKPLL